MENQKNFVQHSIQNTDILPIEQEMLDEIKDLIENSINSKILRIEKKSTEVLYDSYIAFSKTNAYVIKLNMSPDLPNFWKELSERQFSFHPRIVCSRVKESSLKFICYELPKGIFLSDISSYPLSPKLNFTNWFARDIKKIHGTKIKDEDDTIKIFNALCPLEASMIYDPFPLAQLIGTVRSLFISTYKSDLKDCGLAHFDVCPENVIYSDKEFKFLNFEYSGNANIYIDIWAMQKTMNASDQSFLNFINSYGLDKTKLHSYRQAADIFIFAYFNSKVISEYMTFGVANHIKLRYWINKSEQSYSKVANKLFIEKKLDNKIRQFYNLWKQ